MFKNKLAIYILVLVVMVGMFTQSCNPTTKEKSLPLYPDFTDQNPDLFDTSWLTDKPCSTPCWHGLQIGKSSMTDSIATFKKPSFVDSNSMRSVEVKLPQKIVQAVAFRCKLQPELSCAGIFFNKNVLENLSISPNYQITFEQAVEKLGEPDGYVYSPLGAEIGGCDISLIWTKRQMSLGFTEKMHSFGDLCDRLSNSNWKVPKGILVQTVSFMLPKQIEDIKSNDTYILWTGFEKQ
jgi:hypothetical protein